MRKIKNIIESDIFWYIARVLWVSIPVMLIIKYDLGLLEILCVIVASMMWISITHQDVTKEIERALHEGKITIHSPVTIKYISQDGTEHNIELTKEKEDKE